MVRVIIKRFSPSQSADWIARAVSQWLVLFFNHLEENATVLGVAELMVNDVPFTWRSRPKEALVEAMNRTTPLERRSKIRYPVALTVRFRTLGRYGRITGLGQTVNMSSGGILVASEHKITVGARLEINLEWPSLLDGQVPLQLVAVGKVVRCVESGFALSFIQYQFRTMSRKLQSTNGDGWDASAPILIRSAGA